MFLSRSFISFRNVQPFIFKLAMSAVSMVSRGNGFHSFSSTLYEKILSFGFEHSTFPFPSMPLVLILGKQKLPPSPPFSLSYLLFYYHLSCALS